MATTILNASPIADIATPDDLSYMIVTPGEWTFRPATYNGHQITTAWEDDGVGNFGWAIKSNGTILTYVFLDEDALSFDFDVGDVTYYATRATLPGSLFDRANNLIDAQTGNMTLTLPTYIDSKMRSFYVMCNVGLSSGVPYHIDFQGQGNEAIGESNPISCMVEGSNGVFPEPTTSGNWWYSFNECMPHVFTVSLKQLQMVSYP